MRVAQGRRRRASPASSRTTPRSALGFARAVRADLRAAVARARAADRRRDGRRGSGTTQAGAFFDTRARTRERAHHAAARRDRQRDAVGNVARRRAAAAARPTLTGDADLRARRRHRARDAGRADGAPRRRRSATCWARRTWRCDGAVELALVGRPGGGRLPGARRGGGAAVRAVAGRRGRAAGGGRSRRDRDSRGPAARSSGRATAYVCRYSTCDRPTTDADRSRRAARDGGGAAWPGAS